MSTRGLAVAAEALGKAKTAEATAMLLAAEIKEMEAQAQTKRKKLEAEAQAKTLLQIAELESSAAAEGLSEELTEWLKRHRLQKCAADIARIAGADIARSDLQYLTDENVEEIGRSLTQVGRMRLQVALQAVGEEGKAETE